MKILFATGRFYPEDMSGGSKFTKNIAVGTAQKGYEVCVLSHSLDTSMSKERRINNVYFRELEYEGLPVINLKSVGHYEGNEFRDENIRSSIKEVLRTIKPDLIHFTSFHYHGETALAALELKIPYLITFVDGFMFCKKIGMIFNNEYCEYTNKGENCMSKCGDSDYRKRYECGRLIMENARAVVVPSKFLAERYMKEFGVKASVVNHGMPDYETAHEGRIYKKGDKITFGFIGNETMLKGLYVALIAFNKLKSLNNISLRVYGKVSNDDFYSLLKSDNVELCGIFEQKELPKVYNSFDVFICPSLYYESYGYVIKEALAFNKPVIASKLGGITENVDNFKNGILFERGNAEELASAVAMVSDNPELLNYFKKNIPLERGTLEKELNYYIEIYKRILSGEKVENSRGVKKFDIWGEVSKILKEEHSTAVDFDRLKSLNIQDSEDIDLKALYAKISYYEQRTGSAKINYAIWGASVSGLKTKELLDKGFPNFKFVCFFDAVITEAANGCEVKPTAEIDSVNFDMMFICTQGGKKPAIEKMNQMGRKLFDGYLFGWRI